MLASGARARAQDGATRARELFQRGVEAADAGRWEDARQLFADTYELLPRPQVLLNLAGALAQTGRIAAAIDAYERVEATEDAQAGSLRDAARSARLMLEPRLARLRLDFHDTLTEDDEVLLDEAALARASHGQERPMDPGRHSVVVMRSGIEVLREDFRLYDGERLRLDLRVPPPEPAHGTDRSDAPLTLPRRDEPEWFESPIFWTVLGVVVAGAVGIGVAVSVESEEPFVGNLGAVRVR